MLEGPGVNATLLAPFSHEFVTYDLEFIADGKTIDLVSIGMVSGDGRKLYAVNREMDERKLLEHGDGWMRKNVWPHLPLTDLPERSGEFGRSEERRVGKECVGAC